MKAKLSKKIKTVDDLLASDDVAQTLGQLVKDKANIAGIVAIVVDQEREVKILSTFDMYGTLGLLSQATYIENHMADTLVELDE